jgi:hypothetical protein
MKNGRFSFIEMEHIAVGFAVECMKGYDGSFEDYIEMLNKDWRTILKKVSKQETNIFDYHRMITTPSQLCRKLNISITNDRDSDCNCGQPGCTFGCG